MRIPEFQEIYQEISKEVLDRSEDADVAEVLFSYSAHDVELEDFLEILSIETGVSIVSDQKLDGQKVTVEAVDLSVGEILSLVARRLGVELTGNDDLYFLGRVRREDRGTYIRKASRMSAEDLDRAISVMLSDVGRAEVYSDGLVVVADQVEIIEKVDALIDKIELSPANVWVVQLYFVQTDERTSSEYGVDVTNELDLAFMLAQASSGLLVQESGSNVQGLLRGVFNATVGSQDVELVAKPLFLLLDGEEGKITLGERVPPNEKFGGTSTKLTTYN